MREYQEVLLIFFPPDILPTLILSIFLIFSSLASTFPSTILTSVKHGCETTQKNVI